MTLRLRLALAFALLAGLVAAAVGVVVYELTQQDLIDRARAKAVQSARAAASFYETLRRALAGIGGRPPGTACRPRCGGRSPPATWRRSRPSRTARR